MKPKLFWGVPGPRGGGGGHIFSADCYIKFDTDVKQIMIYKIVPSKIIKVTMWQK